MKIFFVASLLLCIFVSPAFSQSGYSQVSGTVIDPQGFPYSGGFSGGGTISAVLVPPGTKSPNINGTPIPVSIGAANLDQNGHFSLSIPRNDLISPANTQWQFTVIGRSQLPWPMGTGSQSLTVTITINNASQDIGSALSAAALSLTNVCPNSNLSTAVPCSGGTTIDLQTNGVNNHSQSLLNFVNTSSVTVSNPSGGLEEFTSSSGNCTLDSVVPGTITASTLEIAGSGYTNGDTGYLFGGNVDATYVITNAVGGVVQAGGYTITAPGTYYTVNNFSAVATSGSGTGLVISVTAVTTGSSGEALYNNAGTCAGMQFYYTTPGGDPTLQGNFNSGGVNYFAAISPDLIALTRDGEVASTLTIDAGSISTSANPFDSTPDQFFQLNGDALTFTDNTDSARQLIGVNGLEFDNSGGSPVATLTAAGALTVQSCVGCGGTVSGTATHIAQFTSGTAVGDTGFVDGTVGGNEAFSTTIVFGGTETFQTTFGGVLDPSFSSLPGFEAADVTAGVSCSMSAPDAHGFECESFTSPGTNPFFLATTNDVQFGDGSTGECNLTFAAGAAQLCSANLQADETGDLFLSTLTAATNSPFLQFESQSVGPTQNLFNIFEDASGGLDFSACTGAACSPAPTGFSLSKIGAVTATNITDSALTASRCVQTSTGGLLAVAAVACPTTTPSAIFSGGCAAGVLSNLTNFCQVSGVGALTTTESVAQVAGLVPRATTITAFFVQLSSAVAAGQSVTVTVDDNTSATAATCTVAATTTTCNATGLSVAVTSAHQLSVKVVGTLTAGTAAVSTGILYQ